MINRRPPRRRTCCRGFYGCKPCPASISVPGWPGRAKKRFLCVAPFDFFIILILLMNYISGLIRSAIVFLCLCGLGVSAKEFSMKVTSITGQAEIKSEGSRRWEVLQQDQAISDNDLIRTTYKSNVEITYGQENIIFLGTSSRLLINIVPQEEGFNDEVAVTVFTGSVYSKVIRGVDYSVYTGSSVTTAKTAIFNCTVDEMTGISGYHVFTGAITLSNITLQGELVLGAGQTSTISPDALPSPARKISARQMSVLTRFYGTDFINQEIERSGIEIVSDDAGESYNPILINEDTRAKKSGGARREARATAPIKLFNRDEIVRKLERYEVTHNRMYSEAEKKEPLKGKRFKFSALYQSHTTNNTPYPAVFVRPGFYSRYVSGSLNIPYVADTTGALGTVYAGNTRELLDKIDAVDVRVGRSFLHLGELDDYSIGFGNLVRRYTNRVYGDNVRDLGLLLHLQNYENNLEFFISSMADFRLMGLTFFVKDTFGYFGVAAVRDRGQQLYPNGSDNGYYGVWPGAAASASPDSLAGPASLTGIEVDFSTNVFYRRPILVDLYLSAASLMRNDSFSARSFGLSMPGVAIVQGKSYVKMELFFNRGHYVRGLFGNLYEDNRLLARRTTPGGPVTGTATMAQMLLDENSGVGLAGAFKFSPLAGVAFSAEMEKVLARYGKDTSDVSTKVAGRRDGSLLVKLAMGEGFVLSRLTWAEVFYSIDHIGYFGNAPFKPFAPNSFTAMGARVHVRVISNLELFGAWEKFFCDRNADMRITAAERIWGFSGGLAAGF